MELDWSQRIHLDRSSDRNYSKHNIYLYCDVYQSLRQQEHAGIYHYRHRHANANANRDAYGNPGMHAHGDRSLSIDRQWRLAANG